MNEYQEYENRSFWKKNLIWIVAAVAIVIFGIILFTGWGKALNNSIDKTVTITGSFSCLPLKDTTASSSPVCELGLHSRDGMYYALDVSHIQDANINLKAEDTIAVTGVVKPQTALAGSKWDKYNANGIIQVNTLLGAR
jgi:hypothetical protein